MEPRAVRRAASTVITVAAVLGVLTVHRGLPPDPGRAVDSHGHATPPERPAWVAPGAVSRSPGFADEQGPVRVGRLLLTASGFEAPGRVRAYEAASGRRRWQYRTGDSAFIRAVSPRLAVVGPERRERVGLDPSTGRQRWRVRLPPGQSTNAATLSGGQLYVGASFTSEGDLRPPIVRALDAATGRRRWRAGLHSREPGFHTGQPLLHRGLVVVSAPGSLLALQPAGGGEVWRVRPEGDGPQVVGAVGPLVLAVVSHDLVALGAGDGRERWRFPLTAGERRWVALGGGRVYALAGGLVIAVDPATGGELWRSWAGPAAGPPLRVAGRIYVATTGGLVTLEAASGQLAWVGDRRQLAGGPVAAGGRVLVTTRSGDLVGYVP